MYIRVYIIKFSYLIQRKNTLLVVLRTMNTHVFLYKREYFKKNFIVGKS